VPLLERKELVDNNLTLTTSFARVTCFSYATIWRQHILSEDIITEGILTE